jgi:hypothetical protein
VCNREFEKVISVESLDIEAQIERFGEKEDKSPKRLAD